MRNAPKVSPGYPINRVIKGYTSLAFTSLGSHAQTYLALPVGSTPSDTVTSTLSILGLAAGVFIWLLAFWFFSLSTVAVAQGFRKMSFTLSWYAFVFPNAGLTLAAIEIGMVLKSPGIDGVTSAMTLALVIAWMMVVVSHVRALWKAEVLWPGKDGDS